VMEQTIEDGRGDHAEHLAPGAQALICW
jgi:hypothetical protein